MTSDFNMIILYMLLSYLIGSVSGSLILGKIWNIDIRNFGSGNAGGTNALRSVGIVFGLLTFTIDLSKGIIPAYLSSHNENLILLSGFSAIIGHIYPVFHNFRGGKGAGTLLGVLIISAPASLFFVLFSWVIVLLITGFVGLSTMIACFVLLLYSIVYFNISFFIFCLLAFLLMLFTHRKNIQRMKEGKENQFNKVMIFRRK